MMKLKNVSHEKNRHGRMVYYFRSGRGPKIRLPDDYGSEHFLAALDLAKREGESLPRDPVGRPSFSATQKRNVGATLERAVKSAKARAKASGVEYDLDKEWVLSQAILQNFKCALTAIPFYMTTEATSSRHPFLPSLDRISAGGGYTKSNVRIVIYAVNVMLMDWGTATFERVANGYRYVKGAQKANIYAPTFSGGGCLNDIS
jgi:hypothetical protein